MKNTNNYRMYSFGNYYLSSIQQGIQCSHGQSNMFKQYIDDKLTPLHQVQLESWLETPTTICLNAGNTKSILCLKDFLEEKSTLLWSYFNEDEDSLGGIITNVSILVPERVYVAYKELIENKKYSVLTHRNGESKHNIKFKTVEDFFKNADTRKRPLDPINLAYNNFKEKYGELNIFEILLADKLRCYNLAK